MDFPSYSNLFKYPESLLTKHLTFSSPLTFILKSSFQQKLHHKGKLSLKASEATSSSSCLTFTSSQISLSQHLSTKKFLTTLEYFPKAFSQLSIKSSLKSSDTFLNKSLTFQLSTNSTTSAVCLTDDLNLHLALTASPNKSHTLGLVCSISRNPLQLVSFKSSYVWTEQDFYLVLQDFLTKTDEFSFKDLKFLGAYQWSGQTTLSWAFRNTEKTNGVQLGIHYKQSSERLFKVRFDQDANLSVCMKTALSPWVSLVTATRHNLFDPNQNEISLRLSLNPNN